MKSQSSEGDSPQPGGHSAGDLWTRDEFRAAVHRAADWLCDYWESLGSRPVRSEVEPGDVRGALPPFPPSGTDDLDALFEDLDRTIVPGLTHWQSPSFFAYYPANISGPSIIADLLSSGLGVQGMLWQTGPAVTELETHVADGFVDLLGLPEAFRSSGEGLGVIQDTASSATLCAVVAARDRAANGDRFRIYTSDDAHSSVEKAAMIAGLGPGSVVRIALDREHRLDPYALAARVEADRRAGLHPGLVIGTVGTTSTSAVDPVVAIGEIAEREGLWFHVDAAYAGSAMICPEFRHHQAGLERADSYCFNPHKWLLTNFDCDLFYVRDRKALEDALSVTPEYLRNAASESDAVIDYRDFQIPLGRRFRALKLWFVVRLHGVEYLQRYIRQHCEWAKEFAGWVDEHPDFERLADVPFSLVCFAHRDGDAKTEAMLERVNATGALFATHTRIGGRYAVRMAIGATRTRRGDVERAWREFVRGAKD